MNSKIKASIAACVSSEEARNYWQSLQPATDWLADSLAEASELDVASSLEVASATPDLEATAKLPLLDIDALPAGVRANLGGTAEDVSQEVA